MTRSTLMAVAGLGSALMLAAAFGFQHLGDLPPCKMCLWQRWPHGVAAGLGLLGVLLPFRLVALAGAGAAAATAGIGGYHSGVEQGWWDGPASCSGASVLDMDPKAALEALLSAPVVRCDEISWEFVGLSMPTWNMIISLGLMAIWLIAAMKRSA
ncbi:MAG: disulfide bond formation protein B [Pseudomonadota bacterium]